VRIQSLARANGILEVVAAAPKGSASLTEVSQALGLNKTTVFNLAGVPWWPFGAFLERSGIRAATASACAISSWEAGCAGGWTSAQSRVRPC
jgi:Transcriptional regulator